MFTDAAFMPATANNKGAAPPGHRLNLSCDIQSPDLLKATKNTKALKVFLRGG